MGTFLRKLGLQKQTPAPIFRNVRLIIQENGRVHFDSSIERGFREGFFSKGKSLLSNNELEDSPLCELLRSPETACPLHLQEGTLLVLFQRFDRSGYFRAYNQQGTLVALGRVNELHGSFGAEVAKEIFKQLQKPCRLRKSLDMAGIKKVRLIVSSVGFWPLDFKTTEELTEEFFRHGLTVLPNHDLSSGAQCELLTTPDTAWLKYRSDGTYLVVYERYGTDTCKYSVHGPSGLIAIGDAHNDYVVGHIVKQMIKRHRAAA